MINEENGSYLIGVRGILSLDMAGYRGAMNKRLMETNVTFVMGRNCALLLTQAKAYTRIRSKYQNQSILCKIKHEV